MFPKTYTGAIIFDTLVKLQTEVDEIRSAMDDVETALGLSSTTYKILREQYNAKYKELKKFKNAEFVMKFAREEM